MRVTIVQESLPQYRVEFFDRLRARLALQDIQLSLVVGIPDRRVGERGDRRLVDWAVPVRNRYVAGLTVQPVPISALRADAVIVEHANRHLLNWILMPPGRTANVVPVGLWGHGGNLQSVKPDYRDQIRRRIVTRADHWFAYTEGSAARVRNQGFDDRKITVVQNSQFVPVVRDVPRRKESRAVFVGGLVESKRIEMLLEIGDRMSRRLRDFELVVVGEGPKRSLLEAQHGAWLRFIGPQFGEQKIREMMKASVVLNPGLVGLSVIDSFSSGTPMVTSDEKFHSPEFEYLRSSENSIVLDRGASAVDYSDALIATLSDPDLLAKLRSGCFTAAESYSLENMVSRFADGVMRFLNHIK